MAVWNTEGADIIINKLPGFIQDAVGDTIHYADEASLYFGVAVAAIAVWGCMGFTCKQRIMIMIYTGIMVCLFIFLTFLAAIFIWYKTSDEMFPPLYDEVKDYLTLEDNDDAENGARNMQVLCDASIGAASIWEDYAKELADDLDITECPVDEAAIQANLDAGDDECQVSIDACFGGVVKYVNGNLFYAGIGLALVDVFLFAVICFSCNYLSKIKKIAKAKVYAKKRKAKREQHIKALAHAQARLQQRRGSYDPQDSDEPCYGDVVDYDSV